jgi:hypothetical protein
VFFHDRVLPDENKESVGCFSFAVFSLLLIFCNDAVTSVFAAPAAANSDY